MNRYTISSDFLESYATDTSVFINLLMVFAQDNRFKVCVDNQGKAVQKYYLLGKEFEYIRMWLKFMSYSNYKYVENIGDCDVENCDERDLFIEIASKVLPYKQLLVNSKNDYYNLKENLIAEKGVLLLDKDEILSSLSSTVVVNQYSYGKNSPNICGNNNSYGKD